MREFNTATLSEDGSYMIVDIPCKADTERKTLIDTEDYCDLLYAYENGEVGKLWTLQAVHHTTPYVAYSVPRAFFTEMDLLNKLKGKTRYLHSHLQDDFEIVDHINHNTLDNRRCNLREATNSKNAMNRISRPNSSSPYKGVWFIKRTRKYNSAITKDGLTTFLGSSTNPIVLAHKYDEAAKEHFGEFAFLNFPEGE